MVNANTNTNFDRADANARQVIRRTKQISWRRFSPEEKVRIVIEGIRGEITVTTLCIREGIASNAYHKWLKDFMEAEKGRLKGDTLREGGRPGRGSIPAAGERTAEGAGGPR